jgi:hypothetical protein
MNFKEKNIYPNTLKNWFLKDHILDYFNFNKEIFNSKKDSFLYKESIFTDFIFHAGNLFESEISKKIINQCIDLNLSYKVISRDNFYNETKDAFSNKIDVIFQPFLKNWTVNHAGFPDIVISKKALLSLKFYSNDISSILEHYSDSIYFIVDIKFSNISDKDNFIVNNSNYINFICSQVTFYTMLLNNQIKNKIKDSSKKSKHRIGKYVPDLEEASFETQSNIAFLYSKNEKLVCVNTTDKKLISDISEAINWIKQRELCVFEDIHSAINYFIKNGIQPNMANNMDYPWRNLKEEIAIYLEEVTLIRGIGNVKRKYLHSNNVYKISDPNICLLENNYKTIPNKQLTLINQFIDSFNQIVSGNQIVSKNFNNDTRHDLVTGYFPDTKEYNFENKIYIYIDIESSFNFKNSKEYIVSIGCVYLKDSNVIEECFLSKKMNEENQEEIINNFKQFLKQFKTEIILVHYTKAENKLFNKIFSDESHIKFLDLYEIIKNNSKEFFNLVSCLNFKLKHLILRLKELNYIYPIELTESNIKSGLEIVSIYNNIEYDNYNKENIENIFKDIKIYNILDCKYLLFLHLFIRKKLIDF